MRIVLASLSIPECFGEECFDISQLWHSCLLLFVTMFGLVVMKDLFKMEFHKASVFYSGNFTLSQMYKVVLSVYKVLNWPDKWFSLASVKNAL